MTKLIVKMDMPQTCVGCPIGEYFHRSCPLQDDWESYEQQFQAYKKNERPDWCPIEGVLPEEHGDLIDRDAFIDKYITYYTEQERKMNLVFTAVEVKQQFADMICDEEVLISAEKTCTVQ